MKIYVIESRIEQPEWTLCNRCFTSYEAAAAEANAMTVESHAANDWKFNAYIHSLELVDDLQSYAEQRRGDSVEHPDHYKRGGLECKNVIKAMLTPEEYRGWIKGDAVSYIWREAGKGGDEDLAKAANMLSWIGVRDD